MKTSLFAILISLSAKISIAQDYKIRTDKTDSFSIALVQLMNAATNQFEDAKGKLINRSWQGDDFELKVHLPGSYLGLVRNYLGNDAEIEFRGYSNSNEQTRATSELARKIKYALGDQVDGEFDRIPSDTVSYYALNIKDKLGYFSSNIEIYTGTSSAEPYLTSPDHSEEGQLQKYFIILKIEGGTPYYFYNVPAIASPDEDLIQTIYFLREKAEDDFETIRKKRQGSGYIRAERRDTLYFNLDTIYMSYLGSRYSANLFFEAPTSLIKFDEKWRHYIQVLQAAVGTGFSYFPFSLDGKPYARFFCRDCKEYEGEIELEIFERKNQRFFRIKIYGHNYHPTKRGMDQADFDDRADWN